MSESVIAQTNNSVDDNRESSDPKADTPNDIKDNGDAQGGDESIPTKKIKLSNDVTEATPNETSVPVAKAGRQKSAKRLNILEKTAKEAEALLQNLGHKTDEDDSNRRRTRSQTRGTPAPSVVTTPTRKSATPKTPTKESSGGAPKRRGRPPKNAVNNNSVEAKTESKTNSEEKTESTEETVTESSDKSVNNTNNTNDSQPEASTPTEAPKESAEEKPTPAAVETATTEQTNDVSAKSNSISGDTSNSVPVIDTQQPTTE